MQFKIKLRKSDKIFSEYIRRRDKTCQLKMMCYGHQEWQELHAHHFYGRGRESVRFDPENCDALCPKCHYWVHNTVEGKQYIKKWKENRMSTNNYNKLMLRANTSKGTHDDILDELYCKTLLNSLSK